MLHDIYFISCDLRLWQTVAVAAGGAGISIAHATGTEIRERGGEAMKIRTNVKAGGIWENHNEAQRVRSALKSGATLNHNEALRVRSALKSGGINLSNHNEAVRVRTAIKAGGV